MNQLPFVAGFFCGKTLATLGRLLRERQLSCCDLAHYALNDITRLNQQLNAFVFTDEQRVLQQAAQADYWLANGMDLGPLHGIPLAIKDNIDTFDMPATYGSAHFARHQPAQDAFCVARLRQAGAVIIGKTLTHEFAYGPTGDRALQGACVNPWNLSCMTGGSSAGNAAAIAAGMVPVAIGTDTGGSIRIPAAFCGITGFKPTWNGALMQGIFPVSRTLDHVGPMAGNIHDVAILFSVLSGECCPPAVLSPSLRVAWLSASNLPVATEVFDCARKKAQSLFNQPLADLDISELVSRMHHAFACIQRSEVYAVHQQRCQQNPELFDEEVHQRLEASALVRGWEYVQALEEKRTINHLLQNLFYRYDLLCLPTCPITAPPVNVREVKIQGQPVSTRDAVLSCTSLWNLAGIPAITLPAGWIKGLPAGLQVVAPRGQDCRLLGLLQQLLAAGQATDQ